jgi:hypothetical protein
MDKFIKEETVTTRTAKKVVDSNVNCNEALISVEPSTNGYSVNLTIGALHKCAEASHFNKEDLGDLIDILLSIHGTMKGR